MAIDDLPLRSDSASSSPTGAPAAPPERPGGSSPVRWVVVAIIALAAGAGVTYWWMTRARPNGPVLPPTTAADSTRTSTRPQPQPMDLPSLDGSDALFRELVGVLSRHPQLVRLLATDGLVRRAVVAVNQIAEGRTPSAQLTPLRPPTRLTITGGEEGAIDPRSYQRWDAAVDALASVNPAEAAQLYVNVKPLFDAAWAELGHPGGNFDTALTQATDVLLATPVPAGDPVLLRRPGYYEHVDPALRSLRPVQKQLLLVGPDSRARIDRWLRAFAAALDLPITG